MFQKIYNYTDARYNDFVVCNNIVLQKTNGV